MSLLKSIEADLKVLEEEAEKHAEPFGLALVSVLKKIAAAAASAGAAAAMSSAGPIVASVKTVDLPEGHVCLPACRHEEGLHVVA